jgi:hypothetical protein
MTLSGVNEPQQLRGSKVSSEYFEHEVHQIDKNQALANTKTLETIKTRSAGQKRLRTLFASIGIFIDARDRPARWAARRDQAIPCSTMRP